MRPQNIWIFLLVLHKATARDNVEQQNDHVMYIEMDELPQRSATLVTQTVFMTKYSESDDKPFRQLQSFTLHYELLKKNLQTVQKKIDELFALVYNEPILMGRLRYGVPETEMINPITLIMPAGYYTSTNYRFTYYVLSTDEGRIEVIQDFAFYTADKTFLVGVNSELTESDLGAPVYAKDRFNRKGLVGIVVEVRIDGTFAIEEVSVYFKDIYQRLKDYDVEMASLDVELSSLVDYIPENKFQVEISVDDSEEKKVATFVSPTAALTYFPNYLQFPALQRINFYFTRPIPEPVARNDMGIFGKVGLIFSVTLIVLRKDFVAVFSSIRRPISISDRQSEDQLSRKDLYYYVYLDDDKDGVSLYGDNIRKPTGQDPNFLAPTANYYFNTKLSGYGIREEPANVGSPAVYKKGSDEALVFGLIKEVDEDGKFSLIEASHDTFIDNIIALTTPNQPTTPEHIWKLSEFIAAAQNGGLIVLHDVRKLKSFFESIRFVALILDSEINRALDIMIAILNKLSTQHALEAFRINPHTEEGKALQGLLRKSVSVMADYFDY